MAHTKTDTQGRQAARIIPREEYQTVIRQQAESLQRKDRMLARLNQLAAQVEALTGTPAAAFIEPCRKAYLS